MCFEGAVLFIIMKGEPVAAESQQRHGLKPFTVVAMIVVAMFSVWLSQIPNAPWSSTLCSRPSFQVLCPLKVVFAPLLVCPAY